MVPSTQLWLCTKLRPAPAARITWYWCDIPSNITHMCLILQPHGDRYCGKQPRSTNLDLPNSTVWFLKRTTLPARQCPGELAYGILMLLVPNLGNVAGDLEQHALVRHDSPRTFFPDTFVKIGDRRAQGAGDLK
jgi:hypothetical protein